MALLLFFSGWLVRGGWRSAAAQNNDGPPVAAIGTELLYEKDFLPPIQGQVQKIRMQEYELKRKSLEAAISKRLVEAEAAKRGITAEELVALQADASAAEPTEEEVEQVWVQQMFGGSVRQSKDEIREQLKQDRLAQARDAFFQSLRQQAGVKIYLLPAPVEVSIDPARVRGAADAPITMVEFSDFQCPFCGQAYMTVKYLLQKYAGKVKLAYRDLPLDEVQSNVNGAGEASRCAGDQGKFWEYHDLLFENQDAYGPAAFREFAEALQLNLEPFTQCLESGKYKALVKEDFQEGIRLGATGTPYFFINGVPVNGARPQPEFEEVIEAHLAALSH